MQQDDKYIENVINEEGEAITTQSTNAMGTIPYSQTDAVITIEKARKYKKENKERCSLARLRSSIK